MGFVEATYERTLTFLNSVGQTQFSAVASEIAATAQIVSVLAVLLVMINMATQTRYMEVGTAISLIFRISMVALFLRSWSDFNAVFNGIEQGFTAIGNRLLAGALGNNDGTSFAREIDNLGARMGQFANVTAGSLNILGSVINGMMMFAIAVLGALATLAMIASRIVLAVLVALAPLAIFSTLSNSTSSYFGAWLSACITMLLYPLVLIGIFSTVLAMGNQTASSINPEDANTIGAIIPILTVLTLSIFLVILSPMIVTLITGSFQIGELAGRANNAMGRGMMGGARYAGQRMGIGGNPSSGGGGPNASAGSRDAAAAAASAGASAAKSQAGPETVNDRAASMNRMANMAARYRRK